MRSWLAQRQYLPVPDCHYRGDHPVVIRLAKRRREGALATECIIALAILISAAIPMSLAFLQEMKLCRAYYYQAVAMEVIDGEMEVLIAGEHKQFSAGEHLYPVHGRSVTNLPPGKFTLTVAPDRLKLEWKPDKRHQAAAMLREVKIK
jgi:hypothetical protein